MARFHVNLEETSPLTVDPILVTYGGANDVSHGSWGFVTNSIFCYWARRGEQKPHFQGVSPKLKKTGLNNK